MSRNLKLFLVAAGLMALSAVCGGITYAVYDHFQTRLQMAEPFQIPTLPVTASAEETGMDGLEISSARSTVKLPYLAVVQLTAQFEDRGEIVDAWSGSGTIVSPDGLILTNAHVVLPDRESPVDFLLVAMTENPDEAPIPAYYAEVVQADVGLDLAVIRIITDLYGEDVDADSLDLPFVAVGDSDQLSLGDELTILGYPGIGGETITLTGGKVSGFTGEAAYGNRAFIKTNATIAGGNSGGPAVNTDGELVGIPTQLGYGGEEGVIDCRILADTNGDGVIDELDTCIPTGGFINSLRPVNLARPLIEKAMRGEVAALDDYAIPERDIPDEDSFQGAVLYQEDFSNSDSGWDVFTDEDVDAGYANGEYQIMVKTKGMAGWGVSGNVFDDVILDVDVNVLRASGEGYYGLICRYVDQMNFYALEIGEDGYAAIWKRLNGREVFLVDYDKLWASPGKNIDLRASCIGNELTIYLDGVEAATALDGDFSSGDVGLLAGTRSRENLLVAFDNLVVSSPFE